MILLVLTNPAMLSDAVFLTQKGLRLCAWDQIRFRQTFPIRVLQVLLVERVESARALFFQFLLSQFFELNAEDVLDLSFLPLLFSQSWYIICRPFFLVFIERKGVNELTSQDCIFCKIVHGEIDAKKVYEDDDVLAFEDVSPQAPVHILVIPKKHISSLLDFEPEDEKLAGQLLLTIKTIAKQLNLDEKGFRVVNNIGQDGGQSVFHIHFHILGGRSLTWPPG